MFDSLQPHAYAVHGILQTRTLEWLAGLFSNRSSQPKDQTQPRDQTQTSRIAGRFFANWATRQAQEEEEIIF